MKTNRFVLFGFAMLSLLVALRSTQAIDTGPVIQVGVNNWFPNPGGTGTVNGQGDASTVEKNFTAIADIPMIVDVHPPTGTIHITERVRNNTGVPWTDFHFLMESIDAAVDLAITFSNVSNPTGEFNSITPVPNGLDLLGNVPDGGTFSLSFDLEITPISNNLFAIHEWPTIGTPDGGATLSLLGIAGVAILPFARRSSKA